MATIAESPLAADVGNLNLTDLLELFGPIPIARLRLNRLPHAATELDVVAINEQHDTLCELVDGILLEKAMGFKESLLTVWLIRILGDFVEQHQLGVILPPDGMMRLKPGQVRVPDISFISFDQFPDGKLPDTAMFYGGPALAVEVLSPGNTKREMENKLKDFFESGVRLVWYIYPRKHEVHVFTEPASSQVLKPGDVLTGGEVLPGFLLEIERLFAH